jgi:hypothetical protein
VEKSKKELKYFSIIILILVFLALLRGIVDVCLNGLPDIKDLPDGVTKEMVKAVGIVIVSLGFIFLLPQLYIGVKGLIVASKANAKGKAHIVWAIILALVAILSSIFGIIDLVKDFNLDNSINLLGSLIDVFLFVFYYVYARRVSLGK